ncbi:sensor histidine kinase [Glacieibacterium frigidum]|uniref:histidine kinase n=1 Tax=Glacieibacterium frigidum TaxID=2593303 RepID=A0A552UI84_9SPHN|nr:HAMP domain-containing sensor histidine kinase [Glacieibacterium frigidum]TRW17900.1 HAMP domain-containing histidine kinase [Glacieibacterium frigidum]
MILLAAAWIVPLLLIGGFALDRVLTSAITRNFDGQLDFAVTAMIAAADIGPAGEVRFTRGLGDQRFIEPYSGLYWQVSAPGQEAFRSRSLWDRSLPVNMKRDCSTPCRTDDESFKDEKLRIVERRVTLPGATTQFHFQVAQSTADLDAQVTSLRTTLLWSLSVLGLGLLILAALQSTYGLSPLRGVSRAIAAIRSGAATRVADDFPREIAPLVAELNDLLAHNEAQAEAARRHAGNLAHALKTPMSVLIGEARGGGPDLAAAVTQQTAIMRRHVDHHLARARAAGRRAAAASRADVWPSLEALARTIGRIRPGVVIDIDGDRSLAFRGEKQDLEEMLGNLLDNAAMYGGGRVFVTASCVGNMVELLIEDDGKGIAEADRERLFERGARLDTAQPGTGLGLAIVRDVAEIYGGSVALGESEDLGGLAVTLRLPAAGSAVV